MTSGSMPSSARRLLASLLPALFSHGRFAPGRPDGQRAVAGLGDDLCRWLEQKAVLVLLGGNPADPLSCVALGLAGERVDPLTALVGDSTAAAESRLHLAGFWRDRRLVLLCLRKGLTAAEFEHCYRLLGQHAGKGELLRSRLFEAQGNGQLPHVSMIFLDDLPGSERPLPWPVQVSLAWLHRDLNLLARARFLPLRSQIDWREQLLATTLELSCQCGTLPDFFANLDLIAEGIDGYDRDELAFALLEQLDENSAGELCLRLCAQLERLPPSEAASGHLQDERRRALQWIARRLAEQLLERDQANPQHLHALVLHKVLLYEEIPRAMRPRVASLQVLTSFLANPPKYFAEVENSHSPEVLATRLWRILEMMPKLVQALRFDVARQVLEFAHRFGATFELQKRPDIMAQLMNATTGVLTEARSDQQAALMQALPQMGRTGVRLLIELADHHQRSVRRTAIDALLRIGPPIVPILFEILETKQGWHYLRNMLLLLAQLNAEGPRVEKLLRKCLGHPEANVRKEALPGIARLLREGAALLMVEALADPELEVRKRAAACLGVTGIADPRAAKELAEVLAAKDCHEELALQIVASINRLDPPPAENQLLESALLDLLDVNGFFGIGSRRRNASQLLRQAAVQALGTVGSNRCRKTLVRLAADQNAVLAGDAAKALGKLAARAV